MSWIKRLSFASIVLLCFYLIIGIYLCFFYESDEMKLTMGVDYAMYYSAGRIAIETNAADAYNVEVHNKVMSTVIGQEVPPLSWWIYPPSFLLPLVPLAFLPYRLSLIIWIGSTLIFAIFALRAMLPRHKSIAWIAFGFPGVLMNLRWGQNAFLSTALLGFGIAFLESNPILSGVMFGLLTFKPQIAIFPLLILLVCKKWKVLLGAGLSAVASVLLSGVLFGFDSWLMFIKSFFGSSSNMMTWAWEKLSAIQPSFYSVFRLAGLNETANMIVVGVIAVLITILVRWIFQHSDRLSLKGSALSLGLFLFSPYYLQYDLMILSIALALLIYDVSEQGSRPWEILMLVLLFFMPLINWPLVQLTGIQICPFVVLLMLLITLLRVKRENRQIV